MSIRRFSAMGLALAVVAAISVSAKAELVTLTATQDPSVDSSFTLDFGALAAPSSANISTTNYTLDLDPNNGTAMFSNYHQNINPLLLPGDISTGDLTVDIVPGQSSGVYVSADGTFQTHDMYQISFTGDLSAYGLTSPVLLPGDSSGQIVYDRAGNTGSIHEQWLGASTLNSPFGPIDFTYTCAVNTVFESPEPTSLALLGLGVVGIIRRRR